MAKEKLKIKTSDGTDVTRGDIKSAKREAKKRKKFERRELRRLKKEHDRNMSFVPPERRPIICPPDLSDISRGRMIIGLILRALVIFAAVAGMTFFVSESFGFNLTSAVLTAKKVTDYPGIAAGAGLGFILLPALFFVACLTLCCVWKPGKFIGIPLIGAAVVILTLPNPIRYIYEAALCAYNGALGHMKYMGFFTMDMNQVSVSITMGSREELVRTAVILFSLICALFYVPFLIKRAKIIVPALFSTAVMVLIFVYNLSRSNWSIALVVASFCALIIMFIFDRIFIAPPKAGTTDGDSGLFGSDDEPQLPEHLRSKKAAKEAARAKKAAAKAEKKARKKGKKVTVDEEISDYFASSAPARPKKEKKEKLTREQKREAAVARREQKSEDRRALGAVRRHREKILLRRSAMGGFAGIGMLVVALIVVSLPAMFSKGSFDTIPAIDRELDYYREYITAILMGDDPALDLLAFEGNENNFKPRDTTAHPIYYAQIPLMEVESDYSGAIYLRGWIGTDYENGAWTTAAPDSETLERWRSLYSTNGDAAESIYYNFFKAMTDNEVFADDNSAESGTKRNETFGYVMAQVNMKRTDAFTDNILYMPSFHIRKYSPVGTSSRGSRVYFLREYGSAQASTISYANFFDGLYTSYRAGTQGTEGYAAVAMIPTMKNKDIQNDLSRIIAQYTQLRTSVAAGRKVVEPDSTDERLGTFSVQLYNGTALTYKVISVADDGTKQITVDQPVGKALYTLTPDGKVQREMIETPEEYDKETGELIPYYAPELDSAVLYFEHWSEEKKTCFDNQAALLDKYTPFVYETYLGRANSQIISDVYREIVENAVVKEEYKDPVPADFSLAANSSVYKYNSKKDTYEYVSSVTDRNVYLQRHNLVMEIVNYLCDEERFTYTLTPSAPAEGNTLDGVETFLTVTKEGYCVQFASSLVLLLREAGIPARYVEGYVATGFRSNRGDGFVSRYSATVRDSNAHAWVEVWFDGIGWVQYEATPEYYGALYYTERETITRPPSDNTDDPIEDEIPEDDYSGPTDYEIEQMLEQQRKEKLRRLIRNIIIIASVTIIVISGIVIFFVIVLKRAKKSAKEREELLSALYNTDENTEELPSRADVRKMGEMIMKMLAECGIRPAKGEFSADFACRLATECERELAVAAPEENLSEFEVPRHPLREDHLVRIFDAIAAEEFGHGAPAKEMPQLARLYYRLRAGTYKRKVNPFRRIVLYLFLRES